MNIQKIKKLIGAALGAVTAGGVLALADALGLGVGPELATVVAGALAALGTYLAPKNLDA